MPPPPPPPPIDDDDDDDDADLDPGGDEDDDGDDVARFVAHLAQQEKVLLAEDASELSELEPLADDPEQLYEALLDSPAIDEIFVSETEFIDLFRQFRLLGS